MAPVSQCIQVFFVCFACTSVGVCLFLWLLSDSLQWAVPPLSHNMTVTTLYSRTFSSTKVTDSWNFSTQSCLVNEGKTMDQVNYLTGFFQTLKKLIPFPDGFDPSYRSPCWHPSVQQRALMNFSQKYSSFAQSPIMCLPQIYFIGFPKSGTSQLFDMMIQHPEIVASGVGKEPHWWTKVNHSLSYPQNVADVMRYLQYFQSPTQYIESGHRGALTMDASQTTVYDTKLLQNLCFLPQLFAKMIPQAKYIVLMREPGERLYSDFKFFYTVAWRGYGFSNIPKEVEQNLTEIFHERAVRMIREMKDCSESTSLDVCSHRMTVCESFMGPNISNCTRELQFEKYVRDFIDRSKGRKQKIPRSHVRLSVSLYHVHLRRWLSKISRKQFLFLRTNDLVSNPFQLLREVWHFLDVKEMSEEEVGKTLHGHKLRIGNRTPMKAKTREILSKFFQPHNDALAELLNDNRFRWK